MIDCNASASAVSTATVRRAERRAAGHVRRSAEGSRESPGVTVAEAEIKMRRVTRSSSEGEFVAGVARKATGTSAKGGRAARRRESAGPPATGPHFTHFDPAGQAHMVDVGAKAVTRRVARAGGRIAMRPETLALIRAGTAKKGDVLGVARIAAIQAAKRTSELIPLCHPIALTSVAVAFDLDAARGRGRDRGDRRDAGPDRGRDGGALRRLRGPPHDLRHVQGRRSRDEDRGAAAPREVRRALGPLRGPLTSRPDALRLGPVVGPLDRIRPPQ